MAMTQGDLTQLTQVRDMQRWRPVYRLPVMAARNAGCSTVDLLGCAWKSN
jgi:hypothetical protein